MSEDEMRIERTTSAQSLRMPRVLTVTAGLTVAAYAGACGALLWKRPR
jgi:hypothetical protein